MSLPVHTAVCRVRPSGAFVVLVGAQLFVAGLYLPPVLAREGKPAASPPQTIISVPVHTAVWFARALGPLELFVNVQVSVTGSYLPPESKIELLRPPRMIISLPVHTAVCES